jgi:hypothetical protein
MRYVFLETNWVVAYAAPAYRQVPAALGLLERASKEELKLLLPSICISEARYPIMTKYQVRNEADIVRRFLLWGKEQGIVAAEEEQRTRTALDRMESAVRTDLNKLDDTLKALKEKPGLEIFDITTDMLERCSALSFAKLALNPFDQTILASILVRAEELVSDGATDLAFCELDSDLQPWDKRNNKKDELADLYDRARVWVYGDFLLETPAIPADWPPAD